MGQPSMTPLDPPPTILRWPVPIMHVHGEFCGGGYVTLIYDPVGKPTSVVARVRVYGCGLVVWLDEPQSPILNRSNTGPEWYLALHDDVLGGRYGGPPDTPTASSGIVSEESVAERASRLLRETAEAIDALPEKWIGELLAPIRPGPNLRREADWIERELAVLAQASAPAGEVG